MNKILTVKQTEEY